MDEVEEFRATILARQTEAEEILVTQADAGPRMELWEATHRRVSVAG